MQTKYKRMGGHVADHYGHAHEDSLNLPTEERDMAKQPNDVVHARFGADAMAPATVDLPGVFPREMGPNTMAYLKEVVDSGLGSDMIQRFTDYLATMHGRKYCIGTTGCTQAIFATMIAMDFEPGDEIIVSPISDYGTVAGILFENYIPVYADAAPGTALIDPDSIEQRITDRTRAIMVVHKLGLCPDMDRIMALARKHDLIVIEDVCQAILAEYKGRLAGTIGDVACFSFDAEKTCGGDVGGAVLTDDDEIYERLLRRIPGRGAINQAGFGRVYIDRGFALQIPQCSAAVTLANLEILPPQVKKRQQSAAALDAIIDDIDGLESYRVPEGHTHSYWMYGFKADGDAFACTVDDLAAQLEAAGINGIGMGRYYLLPDGVSFLREQALAKKFPYSQPPASYDHYAENYSGDANPNARDFLDRWVRWFWTEKYEPKHVVLMGNVIREVANRNRR